MTLDQIRTFANSKDLSIRQIALTKEGARAIIAEHEREVNAAIGEGLLFEPADRADESKFVSHQFARIASCLADEKRLMGEGLVTTAGQRECL